MTVVVPAAPASRWLYAMTARNLELEILPGMLDERDARLVVDLLAAERITMLQLSHAAYRALGEAAGMDWWVALRLAGAANHTDGNVLGELTLRGVDPCAMPLARWCAAVYALVVRNLDDTELMKTKARLFLVPDLPGLEIEDAGMDEAQVVAMLAAMPGVSLGG